MTTLLIEKMQGRGNEYVCVCMYIYSIERKKAKAVSECRMSWAGEQEFENGFQEGKSTPDTTPRGRIQARTVLHGISPP